MKEVEEGKGTSMLLILESRDRRKPTVVVLLRYCGRAGVNLALSHITASQCSQFTAWSSLVISIVLHLCSASLSRSSVAPSSPSCSAASLTFFYFGHITSFSPPLPSISAPFLSSPTSPSLVPPKLCPTALPHPPPLAAVDMASIMKAAVM